LGGAKEKVPKTILELAKNKKVILFVDGDRGGELILKNVLNQMHVDYVARAPKGMEVEQLTGKEIARALAQMVPAEEVAMARWCQQRRRPSSPRRLHPQPPRRLNLLNPR